MPCTDVSLFTAEEFETLLEPTYRTLVAWTHEAESFKTPAHPQLAASTWKLTLKEKGCSRDEIQVEVQEALRRSVNPWTVSDLVKKCSRRSKYDPSSHLCLVFVPAKGRFWEKLYSKPDPVGVIGDMVMACSNASGHVESANPFFAQVEVFCVKELAKVFGLDTVSCKAVFCFLPIRPRRSKLITAQGRTFVMVSQCPEAALPTQLLFKHV